jgi:hypothetical protein
MVPFNVVPNQQGGFAQMTDGSIVIEENADPRVSDLILALNRAQLAARTEPKYPGLAVDEADSQSQ